MNIIIGRPDQGRVKPSSVLDYYHSDAQQLDGVDQLAAPTTGSAPDDAVVGEEVLNRNAPHGQFEP